MKKTVISANKIMKNKANLNNSEFTATSCNIGGYSDLRPKTQNGTNPNKPNSKPISWLPQNHLLLVSIRVHSWFQQIKKMENEPNFNESGLAATNANRNTYNGFCPKKPKRNEPKRTQSKPISASRVDLSRRSIAKTEAFAKTKAQNTYQASICPLGIIHLIGTGWMI